MLTFKDLPYELQCKIFQFIGPTDFSNVCSVSKYWNGAMNDSITWIGRLKENNMHSEPDILHYILFDRKEMMNYYLLQRKTNLLKNINMDDGQGTLSGRENFPPNYEHWDYYHGDWRIERHIGCDPFPPEAGIAAYNTVTSYFSCSRKQKIDLTKWYPNIGNLIKSGFAVRLHWNVWIAARYDCHSIYSAYIMYGDVNDSDDDCDDGDDSERILLGKRDLPAGRKWTKLSSSVDLDPSKGTSFSYFESGQDSKFWAGHYGAKILNPTINVRIIPGSKN